MPVIPAVSAYAKTIESRVRLQGLKEQISISSYESTTGRAFDPAKVLRGRTEDLVALRATYSATENYKLQAENVGSRLDVMVGALEGIQGVLNEVRDMLLTASNGGFTPQENAPKLARAAIDQVIGYLNADQAGKTLFAGTVTDTTPFVQFTEAGPSGFTPQQVLQATAANFVMYDQADLENFVSDTAQGVASIFENTNATTAYNFDQGFYRGNATNLRTRVDRNQEIEYGVNGADQAIRDVMKVLFSIAGLPGDSVSGSVPEPTFQKYTGNRLDELFAAQEKLQGVMGRVFFAQQTTERARERNSTELEVINFQINLYEEVDQFEAATRLSALNSQLEATLSITGRIQRLSLVNFI